MCEEDEKLGPGLTENGHFLFSELFCCCCHFCYRFQCEHNQIGFALNLGAANRKRKQITFDSGRTNVFKKNKKKNGKLTHIRNSMHFQLLYSKIGKWCMKITCTVSSLQWLRIFIFSTKTHLIFVGFEKPLVFFFFFFINNVLFDDLAVNSNYRRTRNELMQLHFAWSRIEVLFFYRIWGWTPLHAHFVLILCAVFFALYFISWVICSHRF